FFKLTISIFLTWIASAAQTEYSSAFFQQAADTRQMAGKANNHNDLLRALPSIDSILKTDTAKSLKETVGAEHLTALARRVTDEMRQQITAGKNITDAGDGQSPNGAPNLLEEAEQLLLAEHRKEIARGLQRVI